MKAINQLDWDLIRVFLAAVRSHSLREAADRLHISHPTASRRLSTLEEELGLQLFDRRTDGLHLTAAGAELEDAADEVESAMLGLSRTAQAADPELRGRIRFTFPEIFVTHLLMPHLQAFAARWPEIDLELDGTYNLLDLDKREADIAIRAMPKGKLPDDHLLGRLVGESWSAIYGEGDQWIGWRGELEDKKWIKDSPYPDLPSRHRLNDGMLQKTACMAGMGVTQLPCFFAEPELKRRSEPIPGFDIWILLHPDLRRSPRLKVFREALAHAIALEKPRLRGTAHCSD